MRPVFPVVAAQARGCEPCLRPLPLAYDARLLRNRPSAMAKNTRPMASSATKSGHTTSTAAPRNNMAVLKLTKWVDGEHCITHCSHSGMLSSGVLPPDNRSIGMTTGIASKPNCGVERASVARNIPSAVLANR